MKYIISESKLKNAMIKVFNQEIDFDELKFYHPVDETEDGEEYEDNRRSVFYVGDPEYYENEVFRYYECDYFSKDAVEVRKKCPILTLSRKKKEKFDGFFGDLWVQPFKEWVNIILDLNPKTINYF
jgi:hypothetical protein